MIFKYIFTEKLGTWDCVKADFYEEFYTRLNKAKEILKDIGINIKIEISYSDLEKCKYYFKQNDVNISDIIYEENISLIIEITKEKLNLLEENKHNLNFKIINQQYLGEKYIIIK